MPKIKNYAFVLGQDGQRLDPTIEQNAWRLIRQHKAKLVSKFPMVIRLNKIITEPSQLHPPKEVSACKLACRQKR